MLRQIGLAIGVAVLIAVLGTPASPLATQHAYARASVVIAVVSALAGLAGMFLIPARRPVAATVPAPAGVTAPVMISPRTTA